MSVAGARVVLSEPKAPGLRPGAAQPRDPAKFRFGFTLRLAER